MSASISLIVHTRNSASTIGRLLDSTDWIRDRVVIDMMSTDGTRELVRDAGCRLIDAEPGDVVDAVRDQFLGQASGDWTLVLDSDEYLALDAEAVITELITRGDDETDAYALPRYNRIGDTIMRGSAFYPDHQIRLFRTGTVSWKHGGHHHRPEVKTGTDRLTFLPTDKGLHIHHDNYRDLGEFIAKQVQYARTDVYASDPQEFDFTDYVAAAYSEYNMRFDPHNDGDLSKAIATIMAWNHIVKGLIHWDRLDPRPPLPDHFSLPVGTMRETPKTEIRRDGLKKEEKRRRKKWRRFWRKLRGKT